MKGDSTGGKRQADLHSSSADSARESGPSLGTLDPLVRRLYWCKWCRCWSDERPHLSGGKRTHRPPPNAQGDSLPPQEDTNGH